MNEFKRSLLIVFIAGAMSTYSYAMLPSQEDMERAEAFARERAATTAAVPTPSTLTAAPVAGAEGLRSPSDQILPGAVPAAAPSPREKSILEMTVYHADASAAAASSDARTAFPNPTTPLTHSRSNSSASSVSVSDCEFYDAPSGRTSQSGSVIKEAEPVPERARANNEDFVAAQERVRAKQSTAAQAAVGRSASAEIHAAARVVDSKEGTVSRDSSEPIEEAILRSRDEKFTPSAASVLPIAKSDSDLATETALPASAAKPQPEYISGLTPVRDSSSTATVSLSDVSSQAVPVPVPAVDVPASDPAAAQKDSLLEKVKRNKLKTFALILALAEAADLTQAYFLKTTKEELQDKTFIQKAKLVAQKMYTAKLLNAAKNGLMDRVVPGILDLKQKAQDYINKKKQTA